MAKHRIRRWFQFGVLDLLILTAIVAVGATLWRPAEAKAHKAPPWIVGGWSYEGGLYGLELFPDGFYACWPPRGEIATGFRWMVARLRDKQDAFVLICGAQRFVVRSEWGSGVLDVLNEDGSVNSCLYQDLRFDGEWVDGLPDGTWKITYLGPQKKTLMSIEYREGVPIDGRDDFGKSRLDLVNVIRKARGLPPMDEEVNKKKAPSGRKAP